MNLIEVAYEWLLAATLRASVLAVVILGIQYSLRRWLPAAWRHALWLPMLAVLILPVLIEAPIALAPLSVTPTAPEVVSSVANGERIAISGPYVPETSEANTQATAAPQVAVKFNVFAILWLVGAIGVLAVGLIGYRRNMRIVGINATAPDRVLQASIAEAAREAGLKRAPQTMISPDVASPAVTGFMRPVLLLPAGFPEGFSAAETRLILLHEFTHLKRCDLPLNWLMCVLQAMHWFNPLLWFAFARMRADRELACDARVLSIDATDRRAEYGGALLKLQCAAPGRALSLGFVGIFERGSEIKSRIREISAHRQDRIACRVAGGAIVSLLMVFGVTKGQQTSPPAEETKTVKEVVPAAPAADAGMTAIIEKLNSIIIPRLDFEDTTIEEAINFLRMRAMELDVKELDPMKKGLNFVIRKPHPAPAGVAADLKIRELRLKNVPLGMALKYICDQTNLRYTVDDTAVVLSSPDEVDAKAAAPAVDAKAAAIQHKLKSIIIPKVDFEDTPIEEAINFLRTRATELDVQELDPKKKGLNFVIRSQRGGDAPILINGLSLRNVSLGTVLKYICEQTNLSYTVDEVAVTLSPKEKAGVEPAKPENR